MPKGMLHNAGVLFHGGCATCTCQLGVGPFAMVACGPAGVDRPEGAVPAAEAGLMMHCPFPMGSTPVDDWVGPGTRGIICGTMPCKETAVAIIGAGEGVCPRFQGLGGGGTGVNRPCCEAGILGGVPRKTAEVALAACSGVAQPACPCCNDWRGSGKPCCWRWPTVQDG